MDVTVGEDPESQQWQARLQRLLAELPRGSAYTIREMGSLPDVVTVHDVTGFLRERGDRNPPYNGRSVFYFFVEQVHHLLSVLCSRCMRGYLLCRCDDRGADYGDGWKPTHLLPPSSKGQDFWLIERASLMTLSESDLPPDRYELRRERTAAFLRYIQQKG